jgi:two-component system sensor histidine kinase MtrB
MTHRPGVGVCRLSTPAVSFVLSLVGATDAMNAQWWRIPRPSLKIQTLVVLWAGCMLLAWAILVGGWFLARSRLVSLRERVRTDVQELDAARKLDTAILEYVRQDSLWNTTGLDSHRERRDAYLREAEQIAAQLGSHGTTVQDRELSAQIERRLQALPEQPAPPGEKPLEAGIPAVDDILGLVDRFQALNEDQMSESIQATARLHEAISDWAVVLSLFTAGLLSVGSWGIIRRLVRPTLALSNAADAFGKGDFAARVPVFYADELGGLARTFNNMANDIANREKGRLQFVAMVVHDLKNPVLAIEMAARLLHSATGREPEFRSWLDSLHEEAQRLRTIVHDLTDDIQVTTGRFSVQKAPLELCAAVRQLLQAQTAAFSDHLLVVEAREECPVLGDARRLQRVVMNLVSNACKYSPPRTRVTVRIEKRAPSAVLSVSDEGPGISKEDLSVLFQPFGRGRSADTIAEGTGIGLYVVKQIVEAHGGRIEVESEPGHGATFRVSLPLAPERAGVME